MKAKSSARIQSTILLLFICNLAVSQTSKDVKIGKQTWMGTNLNVDKFRNGDLIQEARTNEQWQEAADNKQPAWCYFNNNPGNNESYGKLYNWYAVSDPRGLAPIGYHLPSKGEWDQVISYLGGGSEAGGKMKCTGTQYWTAPNSWATNTSGFSGRAGGARSENSLSSGGSFYPPLGIYGIWWTTTEAALAMKEGNAITTQIYYTNPGIAFSDSPKGDGYSVRCVKDFFLAGTTLEPEMVRVEGGTFIMGNECGSESEKPLHEVTVSNFSISKYEITQAHWKLVMGSDDEIFNKGCEKCPVDNVNWNRAQEFVQKLSSQTGKQYRLPTEAEWEYAARGGNKSRNYMYSGGNSIEVVAWYEKNSGGKAHAVGTKQANELGIFDMTGNVEEWCSDWSGSYSGEPTVDPLGPITYTETPPSRVLRGGGRNTLSESCRNTSRSGCYPWGLTFSGSCGLRVVREIKLEELNALNDTIRKFIRADIDNKDYMSALEKMKSVLTSNGTSIPWDYAVMGYCSVKLSDYEGALSYYKTGLNKFPNLKSANDNLRTGYNSIGWSLMLKKEFSSALRYLKEGFDKYPSDLYIMGNLAHAYLLLGNHQLAKKIYSDNRGKYLKENLSWESMVNDDIKEFQASGITNEHFQEILDLMNN